MIPTQPTHLFDIQYYMDKRKGLRDWLDLYLEERWSFTNIGFVFKIYEETGLLFSQYKIPFVPPFDEWWKLNYKNYTPEYLG